MWYFLFKHVFIGPALRALGRPRITGTEHIPPSEGVIVAANHLAVIDSLYLALMLPRRVVFVAKDEYFTQPGVRGAALRWFFESTGQIAINRAGADAAAAALRGAQAIVEGGGIWGIHPEGTRSPDGRLYRGKTGVVRVALATGAPIIPVAIAGTATMNPPGSRWLRPGRVTITIGAPIAVVNASASREGVREATDLLMLTLQGLSGQEYVDSYAANRRR